MSRSRVSRPKAIDFSFRAPTAMLAVVSLLFGFGTLPCLAEDSPECSSAPGPTRPAPSLVQDPHLDPAGEAPSEGRSTLRAKLASPPELGRLRGERPVPLAMYETAQSSSSSGGWWSRRTRAQKVGIVVGMVLGAAVVVAAVDGGGSGGGGY